MINYKALDKLQIFLLAILTVVFFYLFIENFLFSSNFNLLLFREVDDVAFQTTLRDLHTAILELRFGRLFKVIDYGYGWIFWFPLAIITFPFFLLSSFFGIDFPLIVIPRQISLLFSFATLYILHQILSVYTTNRQIRFYGVLLFLSYPTFGYFSLRFGTVSQVMFFSCLTFYLTIRKEILSRVDLKYIAISLAAAGGTKLSGLLIAPLIFTLIADRYKWQFNKNNLKDALFFLFFFLLFFIVFSDPALLISPFKTQYFSRYIESISYALNNTRLQAGSEINLADNFRYGIVSTSVSNPVFIILSVLLFIAALLNIKNKTRYKLDFIYISCFLAMATLYLVNAIKSGPSYIGNYFTSLSFLLILSLLVFDKANNKVNWLMLLLLIANLVTNHKNILASPLNKDGGLFHYNAYYQKSESDEIRNQIRVQGELQAIVGPLSQYQNKLGILQDFQAPTIYSGLNQNVVTSYVFDNINVVLTYLDSFDYILLSKNTKPFLDERNFKKIVQNSSQELAENYLESRKIIRRLLTTKKFKNDQYELVFNEKDVMLFKKR